MLRWIWAALLLGAALRAQTVALSAKAEPAKTAKPQPIPFSHRLHARLGLECLSCHEMPEPGWEMTYPTEDQCMQCHETINVDSPDIVRLAQYHRERKPVPWVPVYRLPDYVFFSHARHVKKAAIDCGVCHGRVAEHDMLVREKSIGMAACMDCHKEKGARNTCRTCHER